MLFDQWNKIRVKRIFLETCERASHVCSLGKFFDLWWIPRWNRLIKWISSSFVVPFYQPKGVHLVFKQFRCWVSFTPHWFCIRFHPKVPPPFFFENRLKCSIACWVYYTQSACSTIFRKSRIIHHQPSSADSRDRFLSDRLCRTTKV